MERLTTEFQGYNQLCECLDTSCSVICKDNTCHLGCPIQNAFDKLAHYEDLEEQGLLLKLPCKVGDTLYQVISSVEEYIVTTFGVYDNRLFVCADNMKTGICFSFNVDKIGKRYFLTKEVAETALAEIEKQYE